MTLSKHYSTLTSLCLAFILLLLAACSPQATTPAEQTAADEVASLPTAPPATATAAPEPTNTSVPEPTDAADSDMEETAEASMDEEEMMEEDADSAESDGITNVDNRSDRLRSLTATWNTDWSLNSIDFDEVLSGGPPRDGIPSIDNPQFIDSAEADAWLADNEPVVSVEIDGEARAYPLQILTWHEIVNDSIGDTPIIVTFCPLCNSAIVFEAVVNGQPTEFGVSGLLRNSDMIMYDRQTESLWQQFTGEGIVGSQTGQQLTFLASTLVGYGDFKAAFPDGVVLSRDTGLNRNYGTNPYVGYDTIGSTPFLFSGPSDGRLDAVARVVTVHFEESDLAIAYPVSTLADVGAINDVQDGQPLAVFHMPGTSSALGARVIAEAEDVGATGVYDPTVDGQVLTFSRDGDAFVDAETGTRWNILGQAIEGELAGTQLTNIVSADHFWFSWAAFRPDTIIYAP